jgi:hypothetical protein
MSLHLPITTLVALSLASGERVVGIYDGPPMAINHARLANSSFKPDLSEELSASIADDFRIAPERVVSEDVAVTLKYAEGRFRDWSETAVLTLNRPDHGPMMLPMSFSARARLFGLATCTALVALILAIFLGIM